MHISESMDVCSAHDWALFQEAQSLSLYDAILRRLRLTQGVQLLDVGCASGHFCSRAIEFGADVTGVDTSPALIAGAEKKIPDGKFRVATPESLPFATDAFTVVTAINSVQYCSDPVRAMREVRRVTRVGGAVVLAAWSEDDACDLRAPLAAVEGLVPRASRTISGPLQLAADGSIETLAIRVDLTLIDADDVRCDWRYPDEASALRALMAMGPSIAASRAAGSDTVRERLRAAIAGFRDETGAYVLRNTARWVLARVLG